MSAEMVLSALCLTAIPSCWWFWAKPICVLCNASSGIDQGQGSARKSLTHSFLFLASFDQLTHLLTVCFTSQAQRDIIFELRRIAFDAESDPSNAPGSGTEKRKAMYTKDYKMLGFTVSFPDTNTVDLLP